jgi:thioredoxin-dependent peroxiredoxin
VAFFAASVDTPETNKKYAEELGVNYPILSDPDKKVARAYGVITGDRPYASRWTFYIGRDGKILYIDKQINVASSASDILARLKELGIGK